MTTESVKAPATVTIDAEIERSVVDILDESGFMLLDNASTNHEELFYFAMALGWENKLNPELAKPKSGGFIRTESFSPKLDSMIETVHYALLGFDNPSGLVDHREAYKEAERYANGGFRLLQGELEQNRDSEVYANELIAEMNGQWENLFGGR